MLFIYMKGTLLYEQSFIVKTLRVNVWETASATINMHESPK